MATVAIGITVARRVQGNTTINYVQESIRSLRTTKFTETVHAFCEPEASHEVDSLLDLNVQRYVHSCHQGCFPNFRFALQWLYDNTAGDWLIVIQDDCIWHPDARAALERGFEQFPDAGFLSPYTSRSMVEMGNKGHKDLSINLNSGWWPHRFHRNAFWGAVALVFSRQAAEAMLGFRRFVTHDHHRKVDVVIGNCTRDMGKTGYVHIPSICDHIGRHSTIGRDRFKQNAWARIGLRFDTGKPL
jgi:hypothetical protein